jgi:hypothetical protein
MQETGKTKEILDLGYSVDDVKPKKRKEYRTSELRFIESLEDVCERILEYNIHKERKDSTRFAKGMSQTFQTLHGLVDKVGEKNLVCKKIHISTNLSFLMTHSRALKSSWESPMSCGTNQVRKLPN